MNVYEEMWRGLVQRLDLSRTYSINQNITASNMLELMAAYEKEYEEKIKAYKATEEEKGTLIESKTEKKEKSKGE
jgi:hypothetical protein